MEEKSGINTEIKHRREKKSHEIREEGSERVSGKVALPS